MRWPRRALFSNTSAALALGCRRNEHAPQEEARRVLSWTDAEKGSSFTPPRPTRMIPL